MSFSFKRLKRYYKYNKVFYKIVDDSNCKPKKIWVNKGSETYNRSMKSRLQDNYTICIQYITKENLLLQQDLLET